MSINQTHKYLWVQKRNLSDSTILMVDNLIITEGADEYPRHYNHFYKLLSKQKRVYEQEGLIIGRKYRAMSMSGNFNELDDNNRMVPYSYYDDSGNEEDVSLVLMSSQLGYSIPQEDIKLFRKVVTHEHTIRKRMVFGSLAILGLVIGGVLFFMIK